MRKDIFMSMVTESDIKWDVMVSSHWHVTDLCYKTVHKWIRLALTNSGTV